MPSLRGGPPVPSGIPERGRPPSIRLLERASQATAEDSVKFSGSQEKVAKWANFAPGARQPVIQSWCLGASR